jgi:hypothetical protein
MNFVLTNKSYICPRKIIQYEKNHFIRIIVISFHHCPYFMRKQKIRLPITTNALSLEFIYELENYRRLQSDSKSG